MKFLISLCLASMKARVFTVCLVVFALSTSGFLLLGVDRIHKSAKTNFENTISQTDLIIGARSGSLNLLLYSVFRIGNPTNNISWQTYQDIKNQDEIAWTIPISLGDSYRGYRVVGTTTDYLDHYRYGNKKRLRLSNGKWFNTTYEIVLGASVAKKLKLQIGASVVLAHGVGEVVFEKHEKHPFKVVGVLDSTGTPIDQSVHVSLEAITAIHLDSGSPTQPADLKPEQISAFFAGIKRKREIFQIQRKINEFEDEPMSAILPGVAFSDLWKIVAIFENALTATGLAVVIASLLGMLATIITGLSSRSREFAILRSVGAGPVFVLGLILTETFIISLSASILAFGCLALTSPLIEWFARTYFNFIIDIKYFYPSDLYWLLVIVGSTVLIGLVPATMAAKESLNQGLRIRL